RAAPGGARIYRLEAFLSNGNCDVDVKSIVADASVAGWNGFKVRSTASVSARFGQLSVIGADAVTDRGLNRIAWMSNTSYEGNFEFSFDVSDASKGIELRES